MDRRRFVPALDGLEGRQLLSTTVAATRTAATTAAATVRAVAADPNGQTAWQTRINRLPVFLQSVNRDRVVPPDLIAALQNDLRAVATKLSPPPRWVIKQFISQLRASLPTASLREGDAAGLNHLFGTVLAKAGADPNLIPVFQEHMKQLANVDAGQSNPAHTATNDYAMVLQMAMGVGFAKATPTT